MEIGKRKIFDDDLDRSLFLVKYSGMDLEMVAQRVAHIVGLEVKDVW